jgi:signal transduction histidine kinase
MRSFHYDRSEGRNIPGGELLPPPGVEVNPPLGGGGQSAQNRILRGAMWSHTAARRSSSARSSWGSLIDIALAAALFLGTLVLLVHSGHAAHIESVGLSVISVALAALSTFPISLWRRFPLAVFAVTAVASAALAGIGYLIELPIGLTAGLYLLTASRPRGTPWAWRTTILVVAALVTFLGAETVGQQRFPTIFEFHTALVWAVAWFAGERTRLRNERMAQLQERALAAEREREREREFAAATERARIARDLHDSAGHAISVIAVRAGAARLRHNQEPDRSLRALEAIEELARQTVHEIDQMVATLREGDHGDTTVEAPPGVTSLPTLIAQRSAVGLETALEISGIERPLATAINQAVYRIAQEALTNAARHGLGTARMSLTFGDASIDLTITNPMRGDGGLKHQGHGLIGMRERATLLGGSFSADGEDGLFRVHATIPYVGERI